MKIKDQWPNFVKYKKSEEAKKKSKINKENAGLKKFNHRLEGGGYRAGKPMWRKMEDDLLDKGITPENYDWDERVTNWFYGHGRTLDAEGKAIFTPSHKEHPLPIDEIRTAVKDVKDRRFHPDRDNDVLTRVLGNKEKNWTNTSRTGQPTVEHWVFGGPEEIS